MRRSLLVACVLVAVAGVVVSLAAGSVGSGSAGRWVMRDLGTLGGLTSSAEDVNGQGQIVGFAETKTQDDDGRPVRRAFLWQKGRMRDLGTLGGPTSWARGINDRGQVVGRADTSSTWTKDDSRFSATHAFLWQKDKMTDLGTLGGPDSEGLAINERGQVVGSADIMAKDELGWPLGHAFLWESGKMRDLGTLGGPESAALGINDRGQIVGWADTKAKDADGDPISRAFLWQNGKMTDLGTLGGPRSAAHAISGGGQVVGVADTPRTCPNYFVQCRVAHAFLWQKGKMRDLGTFRGFQSSADDIDERGRIVGSSDAVRIPCSEKEAPPCLAPHAFVLQNGRMTDLGSGSQFSFALAINDANLIVGYEIGRYHAVLWTWQPAR